jgi:hypothetical protein
METWKDSVDVSLKSETVCFSEMLVSSYKYTQCYNPETNINITNVKTSNLMESLCFSVVGMMMVMRMIMVLLLMMTMMMMRRRRFALWLSVIVAPSFYIYSYGDTKIIFTLQY